MSVTMSPRAGAEPQPYIGTNALIEINGQALHCLLSHVEISPDVTTNDVTTFCGTRTYPGNVTWHLLLTAYQSWDAAGTDEILCAAWDAYRDDGTLAEFVFRPDRDRQASATNPEYTGDLIPQPYSPVNVDAGAPATIDIDWTFDGEPERNPPCTGTTRAARATKTAAKKATAILAESDI